MGIIAIGAGIPVLAALLYGRFDMQTAPWVLAGVLLGPFVATLLAIALTAFVSWGAECSAVLSRLECGDFFGLFPVDSEWVSFAGAGYVLAITLLWAAGGLALLLVGGIAVIILRKLW